MAHRIRRLQVRLIHHLLKKILKLQYIPADLSLHKHKIEEQRQRMLAIYVEDTLAAGNSEFMKLKEKITEEFESKPREFSMFFFAGVMIN